MSQWWVSRPGGDPVGPVSLETLILGVEQQKVPEDAYVCRVGEQQWHRLPQVEEIWDKLHPEQSRTNVVEQPWFEKPSDPAPAPGDLADADADDATRVYDALAMAGQIAQPAATAAAPVATESLASAPKKSEPKPTAQPQEPPSEDPQKKPTVPRLGAVRAPAPGFRAPGLGSNTSGAAKPAQPTPPSRIHAHAASAATPHDGKSRAHVGVGVRATAAQASLPKPAAAAKADNHSPPASSRQTGFQTMPVRASTVDKAHAPRVTPDKAALTDIPKGTDLAAMLESKEEVSLSQTRPDRPVAKRAASTPPKSGPSTAVVPRIPRAAAAPSEPQSAPQSPRRIAPAAPSKVAAPVSPKVNAPPSSRKVPAPPGVAPAPATPETTAADDEDATVIKPVVPLVFAEPEEATVVFRSDSEAQPSDEAETRPIRGTQPLPMPVRPMEAVTPPVNNDVRPLPAVQQPVTVAHGYSVQHASTGTARIDAVPARVAPLPTPIAGPTVTPVNVALPSSPESAVPPLYDAAEDAPDHAPPAAKIPSPVIAPRPAAGTPLPPTVIVSHPQPQVSLDALGHHALPMSNTDATRPALRSLHPPGTIQISIGALIIGALALVVLVLLVVLLLR